MKVKLIITAVLIALLNGSAFSITSSSVEINISIDSIEIENVKKTIVESYVNGIFLKGDYKLLKKGWHSDCDILILEKGKLNKLPAKYWVDRLKKNPKPLDLSVTYKFSDVRITGYAAIAIVEIYSNGTHLYTDYMCLYKFKKKWKIVTKIFYTYPASSL